MTNRPIQFTRPGFVAYIIAWVAAAGGFSWCLGRPEAVTLTAKAGDVAITAISYPPGKVCGAWPSGQGWCVYEGSHDKRGGRE